MLENQTSIVGPDEGKSGGLAGGGVVLEALREWLFTKGRKRVMSIPRYAKDFVSSTSAIASSIKKNGNGGRSKGKNKTKALSSAIRTASAFFMARKVKWFSSTANQNASKVMRPSLRRKNFPPGRLML